RRPRSGTSGPRCRTSSSISPTPSRARSTRSGRTSHRSARVTISTTACASATSSSRRTSHSSWPKRSNPSRCSGSHGGMTIMHDELKTKVARHGTEAFGPAWQPDGWTIAPGRIELIGNHIDYNGGPVLAAAIDRVIVMATGPIDDPRQIALAAPDATEEIARFAPLEIGDWRSSQGDEGPIVYVKGIVAALLARKIPIRTGVGLAAAGNIPPGFGMSSSAALCLATILALTVDEIEPYEMVAIAREAEHRAGSPVGAMDQSASVAGNVILFDGRDNTYASIAPD